MTKNPSGASTVGPFVELFSAWLAADTSAAHQWLLDNQNAPFLRIPLLLGETTLYDMWAKMDARARFALETARELRLADAEALERITEAALSIDCGWEQMPAWLVGMGGEAATQALSAGAARLAEESWSTPQSLQWAAAVPDETRRETLARGIFARWQERNPAEAAKYLETAPDNITAALSPAAGRPGL